LNIFFHFSNHAAGNPRRNTTGTHSPHHELSKNLEFFLPLSRIGRGVRGEGRGEAVCRWLLKGIFFTLFLLAWSSISLSQQKTDFSGDNALQILHHLSVDIGPRVMGSCADQEALHFAVEKFREYGCDTAYIMPMLTTARANTTSGIAVGIKKGANKRIICIGGHIDSAGPEIPGADDDGSGSAVVMELAHVLAKRQNQSTVVFCCFSGEEQGLEGSRYFVDHFAQLDSIVLMLQVDMANGLGIIDLDPDTHDASAPKWLVRAAVEEFHHLGYQHLEYPTHTFALNYGLKEGSGSDHEPFLREGIPAIDFSTDVSKPIHTPRDNFENFEAGGLQRSGDLVLKLVERFDNGVPAEKTDHYWLYLIGVTPVFVPLWVLWAINILSLLFCLFAILALIGRRPEIDRAHRIRWSRLKIILCTIILVCFAWFSPDMISLIQGVRHPWITHEKWYWLYAFNAFLIGVWFTALIAKWLRITQQSLSLFVGSSVMLLVFTGLLLFLGVKASMYPALGILFLSMAILSRRPSFRFVFMLLAPLPLLRMIFSEWSIMYARLLGTTIPGELKYAWMANGGFVFFFTLCLLPFSYAFVAIIRDTPAFTGMGKRLRSAAFLIVWLAAFIALTVVLSSKTGYNQCWYKDLRANEKFDMGNHTQEVKIQSSEYLTGLQLSHGGNDTAISSKIAVLTINPRTPLDTTWFQIIRKDSITRSGDTTSYNIVYTLVSKFRPYTITLIFDGGDEEPRGFSSPLYNRTDRNKEIISFVSFPDTNIVVPVKFQIVGSDTVHETITAVFDTLAYPMHFTANQTYVIPRTEFVSERTVRK
jgi:aminopeptidase YwaD